MSIRLIRDKELKSLLKLYTHLHPKYPLIDSDSEVVQKHWKLILSDPNSFYFISEEAGLIVSTCILTIIPNLTYNLSPYGIIENVVTDPGYQRKGHGTRLLSHALEKAWGKGCYKVMLATGTQNEEKMQFYEKVGFKRGVKTGFVAYPPEKVAKQGTAPER